jgi:hypothetical protein
VRIFDPYTVFELERVADGEVESGQRRAEGVDVRAPRPREPPTGVGKKRSFQR